MAGLTLCETRNADFVQGLTLDEIRSADFVQGTIFGETRSADVVAGTIPWDPPNVDFVGGTLFCELQYSMLPFIRTQSLTHSYLRPWRREPRPLCGSARMLSLLSAGWADSSLEFASAITRYPLGETHFVCGSATQ